MSSSSAAAGAINPESRARALERMRTEEFDVAIVGGGVVGTGAALDAVSRDAG